LTLAQVTGVNAQSQRTIDAVAPISFYAPSGLAAAGAELPSFEAAFGFNMCALVRIHSLID
jgi:hypothetical protein